jgi:N-acetylmuramoyl-L-alanine amidase
MLSEAVEVRPGCFRNDEERGFSVLFSARGEKSLVEKRRKLSRAIAAEFSMRKFIAYGGRDYLRNYTADEQPGVFIDGRRLFMLEKPKIPSLIIETHQSLAAAEVEHWRKPETSAAFAEVVIAALDQYFK